VSYLLAQKLLAPSKFYLLRGNHELRSVQRMFQFHAYVVQCFVLFLYFGVLLGYKQSAGEINAVQYNTFSVSVKILHTVAM